MGAVGASGPSSTPTSVEPNSSLRHVLLVGGTVGEWGRLDDDAWQRRAEQLGNLCARLGVPWLTIRADRAEPDDEPAAGVLKPWQWSVPGCDVIIDPVADGRQRFADAMAHLAATDEVNEATVSAALYEPADCEPDLVVVLGPPTQLPPSLVWELAYAELVFVDVGWFDVTADDLAWAIAVFSDRRRRFGGLDE